MYVFVITSLLTLQKKPVRVAVSKVYSSLGYCYSIVSYLQLPYCPIQQVYYMQEVGGEGKMIIFRLLLFFPFLNLSNHDFKGVLG